ncbi:efflux RND transporter periplasmic adaptor subunit [Thiorhodovibrio frisius]|uniref:RND family efflux transporter, MFP subunit n=1 Tax=Thiorhodovibrio frisius TaxID=631362 RepID=H8Z7K4_9GAMM|nr:efflux RND transporter periplasmic adaptor subunit [Thiorhodovibrio frisius]EIC20934.1 RND family efflux transporter, MFP subunit [Thiorhodovibrio frisius]WPL21993.1 Multidrug transporter MdtA [Thiorhodovibrio frisius]
MNRRTLRPFQRRSGVSLGLALALALAVTLWMLSGSFVGSGEGEQEPEDPARSAARLRVQVTDSLAQRVTNEVVVQGQLEPWRRLTLRAQVEGKVTALPVEKGAWVEADTLLVELAEDDRPAQLARAQADVAARELELSAAETLGQRGMQAQTQIKTAQAELARAQAEATRLRLEMEWLAIRAPFAGVIDGRDVELGSFLQRADAIVELVDDSRLKATAQVPQQRAGALAIGQPVAVELLDGTLAQGRLIYISRVADAKTRGFRIEAEVPNAERRLASGVSAELRIHTGEVDGHFLSPAALTLNDKGEIGVRTLDAENRVQFVRVDLLRTQSDGLWVSGLPASARIITRGQGFVSEGEQVEPVPQEDGV